MWFFGIIVIIIIVYITTSTAKKRKNESNNESNSVSGSSNTSGGSIHGNAMISKRLIIQRRSKAINERRIDISNITLGPEQQAIYDTLEKTQDNVFITGKAGTGKSVLLEYFVANTNKITAVVAPTGVAALNVGGQTIHSFFKLSLEVQEPDMITVDNRTKEVLCHLDALVIDEISMVRVDIIEAINRKFQIANRNALPFGGVQVIMFGDLFQLPPVVTDGELHRYFNDKYGSEFFFNASSFKNDSLKIYELKHVYRQTDPSFIGVLNSVREGQRNSDILDLINSRYNVPLPSDQQFITLTAKNDTANNINCSRLEALPGQERVYEALIEGDLSKSSYPTEKELRLKKGAQVMLLKNDREKPMRWVNGTIGTVLSLSEDVIMVKIDGVSHSINKETWTKYRYYYDSEEQRLEKEIVSSFTQFPIRLAWAITIHKSQGQTYHTVAIDMGGGAFAAGQTYVALSRCKSMEGMFLKTKIAADDIIVDQQILAFMRNAEAINFV